MARFFDSQRAWGGLIGGETVMQWFFLIAAILGTVLPLSFLFPFVLAHGLDVPDASYNTHRADGLSDSWRKNILSRKKGCER